MSDAAFRELGIGPRWRLRASAGMETAAQADIEPAVQAPAQSAPQHSEIALDPPAHGQAHAPEGRQIAQMDWAGLKENVAGCVRCGLCQGRTKTVFGVGDENATWLFVGEGPGRSEDMRGEPFVGPAGKLLDNMLATLGVARGQAAYIANAVKCRPTGADGRDRPPTAEEMAACMPYLQRQIELIAPSVIVALGKTAAIALLGLDPSTPVSKLRGQVYRYGAIPLVVTYHPAYLLRQLTEKSKAWRDLCLAQEALAASPDTAGNG